MTTTVAVQPIPTFLDVDGQPLDRGKLYFGTAGSSALLTTKTMYWDAALTQVAPRPVPTKDGYASNNGVIARLFTSGDYSVYVADRNDARVTEALNSTQTYGGTITGPAVTVVGNIPTWADTTGNTLGAGYAPSAIPVTPTAGNTSRTLAALFSDAPFVESIGAVGNGVADDTAALQAALNTGRVWQLRSGAIYRITSRISATSNSGFIGAATITGAAANFTSTTDGIGATQVMLLCQSVSGVILDGVAFVTDFSTVQNRYVNCIGLQSSTNCTFENVRVTGLNRGVAFRINSCSELAFQNCGAADCLIDATSNGQLSAFEIDNNQVSGQDSTNILLIGCYADTLAVTNAFNTSFGYQTDGFTIQQANYVQMVNCWASACGEGLDLWGRYCTITNFLSREMVGFGVKLIHGAQYNTISFTSDGAGLSGLAMYGTSTGGRETTGNVITGTITRVGQVSGAPAFSKLAVELTDTGLTYLLTNNTVNVAIFDNASADYAVSSSGTGTGNVINVLYAHAGGSGLYSLANANTTIVPAPGFADSNGKAQIAATSPRLVLNATGGAADAKLTQFQYTGGVLTISSRTDADGAGATLGQAGARSGTAWSSWQWNVPEKIVSTTAGSSVTELTIQNAATSAGTGVKISMQPSTAGEIRSAYMEAATDGATGIFVRLATGGGSSPVPYFVMGPTGQISLGGEIASEGLRVSAVASQVNRMLVTGGATGTSPTLAADGSDANLNLRLIPKGSGLLVFGTYTASVSATTGYITILDAAGNTRRLAVVA